MHHRRLPHHLCAAVLLALTATSTGCSNPIVSAPQRMGFELGQGAYPRAAISHPEVYTYPQIEQAKRLMLDGRMPIDRMHQHFFTDTEPDNRFEKSLHQTQQHHTAANQLVSLLAVEFAHRAVGSTRDDDDANDQPSPRHQNRVDELLTNLLEHPAPAHDSPFDQLDRAHDLYMGYFLKQLRSIPRSTSAHSHPWNHDHDHDHDHDHNDSRTQRTLLLAFQVNVQPGNRPDHMAGVRVRVTGVDSERGDASPDQVAVQRLHPMRAYDLQQAAIADLIEDITSLTAQLNPDTAPTRAQLRQARAQFRRTRDHFISRINKHAGVIDASRNQFGWNFYPSNRESVRRSSLGVAWRSLVSLDPSPTFHANFLDAGVRDAAVYIQVPKNITSITFESTSFSEPVRRHWPRDFGNLERYAGQVHTFTVHLPPFEHDEAVHPAFPGSPALHALSHQCHVISGWIRQVQRKLDEHGRPHQNLTDLQHRELEFARQRLRAAVGDLDKHLTGAEKELAALRDLAVRPDPSQPISLALHPDADDQPAPVEHARRDDRDRNPVRNYLAGHRVVQQARDAQAYAALFLTNDDDGEQRHAER